MQDSPGSACKSSMPLVSVYSPGMLMKNMPHESLMGIPIGVFHGNQAPRSMFTPRSRSSGMTRNRLMLKSPISTLTPCRVTFNASQSQNSCSFVGHLLFARTLCM